MGSILKELIDISVKSACLLNEKSNKILKHGRDKFYSITTKGDIEVNDFIKRRIEKMKVGKYYILSEESKIGKDVFSKFDYKKMYDKFRELKDEYETLFIIDPIDGTFLFQNKLPGWCIALSYYKTDSEELGGVIYSPSLNFMLFGNNDFTKLKISKKLETVKIRKDYISILIGQDIFKFKKFFDIIKYLSSRYKLIHTTPSGSLGFILYFSGKYSGYMQAEQKIWDWLPGYSALNKKLRKEIRFLDNNPFYSRRSFFVGSRNIYEGLIEIL